MTKDELIKAMAQLICDLQVPMSIEGELPPGNQRLMQARAPWKRLYDEFVNIGYGRSDEVAVKLMAVLDA